MSAPRRLKVDLGDLAEAMQGIGDEMQTFSDLRSGELHVIDDSIL